jgi:hypothetical protein
VQLGSLTLPLQHPENPGSIFGDVPVWFEVLMLVIVWWTISGIIIVEFKSVEEHYQFGFFLTGITNMVAGVLLQLYVFTTNKVAVREDGSLVVPGWEEAKGSHSSSHSSSSQSSLSGNGPRSNTNTNAIYSGASSYYRTLKFPHISQRESWQMMIIGFLAGIEYGASNHALAFLSKCVLELWHGMQ